VLALVVQDHPHRPLTHLGCVPRQFVAHGSILSRFGASGKDGAIHIDFRASRGLDKRQLTSLMSCDWVNKGQNLIFTSPTGVGKTWLACAFANQAARRGWPVLYRRLPRLLEEMEIAREDGSLHKLRQQLARTRVLVIDDWGVCSLSNHGRQDLLEVVDDRVATLSTVITSQLPIGEWHAYLGEPTLADAILDRLVHAAHQIALKGESMRKTLTVKPEQAS